jgi:serine/threonine-protein kinase
MNLIAAIESRLGTGWSISGELGTGATSRVYLATNAETGERVVVKLMKSGTAEAERSQHFLLEMQILRMLAHPNIVPIRDTGEAHGMPYFTMPYIDGETVRHHLVHTGAFGVAETVRIARDVASALSHVHSNGVVHRDVKPENLLLAPNAAVLIDFGHARAPSIVPSPDLQDGKRLIVGTPFYVSPEQVSGRRVADSRSDIYSLGCVMVEMLSGALPFGSSSAKESMQRRVEQPPPDIRALRPAVPEDLAAVIKRAMMVDPASRYLTADQLADALSAVLDALPIT